MKILVMYSNNITQDKKLNKFASTEIREVLI